MADSERKTIPIVCGPTGSGKTAAAVRLSADYPIEIVSADSRQIIRHLNIGTAKPATAEREAVRFHLLDIIEPGERYSAYRFIDDADNAIGQIIGRGNIPVVVGGTGLYLRALSEGVVQIDSDDQTVRERLEKEMEELGPAAMHEKLKSVDPDEAAAIHPHNKVRVIRALEIYHLTGKPKSQIAAEGTYKKSKHEYTYNCLMPVRERLYDDIDDRVDRMMAGGLLNEVRNLVEGGLAQAARRSNVIGYSELLEYLEGNLSLSSAVDSIKQNSRRYAKRQMTWFRNLSGCSFFEDQERLLATLKSQCRIWLK